jgi:hypothetical protein
MNIFIVLMPSVNIRHVWDTWDIVWDTLGYSMGQSQNTWDIKNYQHWVVVIRWSNIMKEKFINLETPSENSLLIVEIVNFL